MALNIHFDLTGNPEFSTFILARKNGDKIGMLNVESPVLNPCFNKADEITFDIYKTLNNSIWDEITDFKLIWCKEWDEWFEIKVEINDTDKDNVYKSIIGTSVCEAELSQINLYNIEINTEDDIARDDYKKPTVFYNEDSSISLLNRISEKIPHYTIGHIDITLKNIQKTFSFNEISIYDALQEVAKEVGCIFIFESNTGDNGKISRTIKAYDLMTHCAQCGERAEFITQCPNCGCTDTSFFTMPYGEDTNVFISKENCAESIVYSTNTDEVKTCFKLKAGDDLMTATIRNCNPNGSDYIWHIADELKRDMSEALQTAISEYDENFIKYQDENAFAVQTSDSNSDYYIPSTLINYYNTYYNNYKEYNSDLQSINKDNITNYPALMGAYYNTVDMILLLQTGMLPTGSSHSNAEDVLDDLYNDIRSCVYIAGLSNTTSDTVIENAVKYMIEGVIDPYYSVDVETDAIESHRVWYGTVTVTNVNDINDTYESDSLEIGLKDYSGCTAEYISSKVHQALKTSNVYNYGVDQLFGYKTNGNEEFTEFNLNLSQFKNKLTAYSLSSLQSLYDACQMVLNILIEQGVGDKSNDFYSDIYIPYYNRLEAIEGEIYSREAQIRNVESLQTYILKIRDSIQNVLDFEALLVDKGVWDEFCSYRREDTYENINYISDGLTNSELINLAQDFIKVATNELYKSGELQHNISSSLKNLLALDEFKPLINQFKLGNFIRVEIDGVVYKLRLIEYRIDFDNIEDIEVTFSDVIRAVNGASDLQSILEQSKKMTTSYDGVKRQAKKGDAGYDRLEEWVKEGLNVTNTNIVNTADNNQMTWDEHGISMREYDPVTETYSDKQVKITNKGLYVTDDNWRSARVGVGNFMYFNPKDKQYYESYGVIADTLVGNLILGKEVGIYTTKNDIAIDENGLTISNAPYADYSKDGETKIVINPNSGQPFKITYDGDTVMRVSNTGKVYIDKELDIHNHFIVDDKGNIEMGGNITLGGNINMTGNITWSNEALGSSGIIRTLYSRVNDDTPPTPTWEYNQYGNSSSDSSSGQLVWHKEFDSAHDKWIARYVYNSSNHSYSWDVQRITFLTHIDAAGIYTGTLCADNIYGGHISTNSFDGANTTSNGYMDLYKQIILFNEPDSISNGITTKGDTKMAIGFLKGAQYDEPIIVMGAGNGNGSNVAYINKGSNTFDLFYYGDGNRNNENTKLAYIRMKQDGSIRINGVDFPATSSTDTDKLDLMSKADYWNKKLSAVKSAIKTNSYKLQSEDTSISISPESLGEMFTVDSSTGVISLRPDVKLSWNAVYVLYAKTALSKPTSAYGTYDNESTSAWHKTFDKNNDYYASYSYDGGNTWTDAVKIQGEDGQNGKNGSDGEVDYSTIYSILSNTYNITHTEIDGTKIQSPQIRGAEIYGGNIYGGTFYAMSGTNTTNIKRMKISSDGIQSYNPDNQLHGVVISSNNFSDIDFYYQGELRGGLSQSGGVLSLAPQNNAILVLGTSGKQTSARGNWDFSDANVSVTFA